MVRDRVGTPKIPGELALSRPVEYDNFFPSVFDTVRRLEGHLTCKKLDVGFYWATHA